MGNSQDAQNAKTGRVGEKDVCGQKNGILSEDFADDGQRAKSGDSWQAVSERPRSLVDILREQDREERRARLQDPTATQRSVSLRAAPIRLYTPPPSVASLHRQGSSGPKEVASNSALSACTPRSAPRSRWSNSRPRPLASTMQPAPALQPLPAPSPEILPSADALLGVGTSLDTIGRATSQPPREAAPLELETCMSAGPPIQANGRSDHKADATDKRAGKADATNETSSLKRAFSTPSVDSTLRVAVAVSSRMRPGRTTQDKRRALVALRTTKQALAEMAPFGLPIRKRGSNKPSQGGGRSVDRINDPPDGALHSAGTTEEDVPAERKLARPLSLPAGPCSRWPKEARSTKPLAIPSVEV